jgi:hypothetical protein
LSFFDDDEDGPPRVSARATRRPARPQPRRPQRTGGAGPSDQHTLMVRRRIAAGIGVVLVILIALIVDGCVKNHHSQELKDYNQNVVKLVQASDQQVAHPFFSALAGASGKSPLDVEVQIDELSHDAQKQASEAKGLSVPGSLTGAQRDLLLMLDLRAEGMVKVANLVRSALGGGGKQASTSIAGDMEMFLASDVVYSQRVAPLIQQALASAAIHEQPTTTSQFLPNIGWLEAATVLARLTGQSASAAQKGQVAPGTHGHSLAGVSVGSTTLQPSPSLNHISGGPNPTFTVMVTNAGTNAETDVKVEVSVVSGGKRLTASHVINKTNPGSTVNVDIPLTGVPQGVASRIMINILPVPGETNLENNKGSYLAVFGQ